MLDLDHFKSINDTYGHESGDAVLMDFAHRIGLSVRRSDEFGRIGGEEFLFLLPETDFNAANTLLERIRQGVKEARPLVQAPEVGYSVSIGFTQLRPDDTTRSALSRADQACYTAKRQGRDCVVFQ